MSIVKEAAVLLRRGAVAVVASLCLLSPGLLATNAPASGASSSAYDRSVSSSDCDLLGRVHSPGKGCARTQCVRGAKLYRKVFGAEACQLRNQGEYGFVSTIDYRRCAAIGRRWIPQVNFCASYPDRSVTAVYDAPQCVGTRSVYVNLTEADGYYDECLTPQRVRELSLLAEIEGSDLTSEASERSSIQCSYRPEHAYVNGKCVPDPGSRPATGGVLMIGDSLTWRGTDELGRMRSAFELDGEPARKLSSLEAQLDYYRSGHGQPSGFILELGTVPPPRSFGKSDLARIIRSLPSSTDVMFVLPYAQITTDPVRVSPNTVRVSGWMKALARSRNKSCTADWSAYVRTHPGVLQDGVHVKKQYEDEWASWVAHQWAHC
jgi:hypothetical protein